MSAAGEALRTLSKKCRNLGDAVGQSYRHDGFAAAVWLASVWVAEGLSRPVTEVRDSRRDRKLGIDTWRRSPLSLEARLSARYEDGTCYMPVPTQQFRRVLRSLPVETFARYSFVDLGCGKGLPLLVAAEHGFGTVTGVELDPDLAQVALKNVRSYPARHFDAPQRIEVVAMDAVNYQFADQPTVLLMYNPFGPATMQAVVANIETSLAAFPREMFVLYCNPLHGNVLDRSTSLAQISRTTRWATYAAAARGIG